jgi:hypothetical protein
MSDDDEYLEKLVKDYGISRRKSPIRRIANAIYAFLDEYHIDLNPMERERLSLYLVHYKDSKKAAAHIIPINPGIKKIPGCTQKIAGIIDEITEKVSNKELSEQGQGIDDELKQALERKPVFEEKSNIEIESRRNKLSKIRSFTENNVKEEDEEAA